MLKVHLTVLSVLLIYGRVLAQETWKAELDPALPIGMPVCRGYEGAKQPTSQLYKLCLPSSGVKNIKIGKSAKSVVLEAPGYIKGPVLINSSPPAILIGAMAIKKGSMSLNILTGGGFEMKGIGGVFEVEGLIAPLMLSQKLNVDEVELEFTSPEDARLEIFASGQQAGIVLRVRQEAKNKYYFTAYSPSNSIFPDNPFSDDFEGIVKKNEMHISLKGNIKIILYKNKS